MGCKYLLLVLVAYIDKFTSHNFGIPIGGIDAEPNSKRQKKNIYKNIDSFKLFLELEIVCNLIFQEYMCFNFQTLEKDVDLEDWVRVTLTEVAWRFWIYH